MKRSPISTAVLIALKKELPPRFKTALRNRLVKGEITFPTEEIAFDKIKKGRSLAPLVSPMQAGKPNRAKGGTQTTVTPAYVKPHDLVTAGRLIKRAPGEALNGELTPAQRLEAVRSDILLEQEECIERREEWMVCEVLKTGGVVLESPDFEAIHVDYQRRPENNVTLSGADRWSVLPKDSQQPLDDLEDWMSNCNMICDEVYMGREAWKLFKSFDCVKDLLNTRRGSSSKAESGPLNNGHFKWVATLNDIDIFVYNGAYEDEKGVEQLYIDTNGVLTTSSLVELYMAYGAIQDVEANANGLVEATRYPKNWFTKDPSAEHIQTQAAPIPVMLDPNEACYALV